MSEDKPKTQELPPIPGPIILVPALSAYYDVKDDHMKIMLNGVPVGGATTKFSANDQKCKKLTQDVIDLMRSYFTD